MTYSALSGPLAFGFEINLLVSRTADDGHEKYYYETIWGMGLCELWLTGPLLDILLQCNRLLGLTRVCVIYFCASHYGICLPDTANARVRKWRHNFVTGLMFSLYCARQDTLWPNSCKASSLFPVESSVIGIRECFREEKWSDLWRGIVGSSWRRFWPMTSCLLQD